MTDVNQGGGIYDVKQTIVMALAAYSANLPAAEKAAALSSISQPSPVDCLIQFATAGYSSLKKGIADAPTLAAMAQAVGQACALSLDAGYSHIDSVTLQGMLAACRRWLGATTTPDPSQDPPIPAKFQPAVAPATPAASQ